MRFNFLVASFAISGILGAAIISPGESIFDSYVKGAETVANSTTKPETLELLRDNPDVPFVSEDYLLINPQLAQPEVLGSLLVDKQVNLNLTGLSVSPEEAKEGILAMARTAKESSAQLIRDTIHYKTKLPTHEEAVKRIHASLDRMDKIDNLEQVLMTKATTTIKNRPNLIKYIHIAITALPEVFEHDVIGYLSMYFKEADAYNPDVARTLRKVLFDLQTNCNLFPAAYYTKIKNATPIAHDKHY